VTTYLLKTNAHPAVTAFPQKSDEWEGIQFFGPLPRTVIGSSEIVSTPQYNDRVHVWINERGGGGGYTGYGTVRSPFALLPKRKKPEYEFRLSNIQLLPSPLTGEHFWSFPGEAISSVRRYTLRQMLWMNDVQTEEFEDALQQLASRLFGLKSFI
jgi:hypothetical protein